MFYVRIPTIKAPYTEGAKPEAGLSRAKSLLHDLDIPGFVLLTGFAIELLLALQWGGSVHPWDSSVVIGLLCGSIVTFVVFLFWQHRQGDNAMIPFSIVSKTVVWCGCIVFGFLMAALFLLTYYLPIYFQSVKGASAILSGVYTLPNILAQLSAAILSGVLGASCSNLSNKSCLELTEFCHRSGAIRILSPLECCKRRLDIYCNRPNVHL